MRYWEVPLTFGAIPQIAPTYHRLKEVFISEYFIDPHQIAAVMKLPAIEQLHVLGLHEPLQQPSWT
jgi:hypothetical protein